MGQGRPGRCGAGWGPCGAATGGARRGGGSRRPGELAGELPGELEDLGRAERLDVEAQGVDGVDEGVGDLALRHGPGMDLVGEDEVVVVVAGRGQVDRRI